MAGSNNTIVLDGCIKDFVTTNELTVYKEDELFEIFSAYQITKKYNISFSDIENAVVDGSLDGGIDIFLIIIDDHVVNDEDDLSELNISNRSEINIFIGQAKRATGFVEAQIDKFIASANLFYDLEVSEEELLKRFNTNLIEKITLFRKILQQTIMKSANLNISYYYATRSNEFEDKYPSYQSKIEQLKHLIKSKIYSVNIYFLNISAKELLEYYRSHFTPLLELIFKDNPIAITYTNNDNDAIGYIGVVKLKDFKSFIIDESQNLRDYIFENNIRHYQGTVDVNKKIQNTIEQDFERDFWWLNNGITIIATSASPHGKKLFLNDPQIVNGLQTSFSIYKYYTSENDGTTIIDDRSVLVKIIQNNDKVSIDKIISSTNNQNPVSPILLRATEDLQRNIEMFFLNQGYYYDRRKNYYKNQGKALSKIFSIQFTAQAIEAIMNWNPSAARSRPTTLIKTDKSYETIFNEKNHFNIYLNSARIVQMTKNFILDSIDDKGTKNIVLNFTFHISRLFSSYIIGEVYFGKSKLIEINLDLFTKEAFLMVLKNFSAMLKDYQDSSKENIINISKSQKFTDYLNNEYSKYF